MKQFCYYYPDFTRLISAMSYMSLVALLAMGCAIYKDMRRIRKIKQENDIV